jgi:hypothetical protein
MSRRCSVFSYALCVFRRPVDLLGCSWRRLLRFCASSCSGVSRGESAARQVGLCLLIQSCNVSLAPAVTKYGGDLSNKSGLPCGDLCLCGAIMDLLSELGGRGFGLDDGSGCLVPATRN